MDILTIPMYPCVDFQLVVSQETQQLQGQLIGVAKCRSWNPEAVLPWQFAQKQDLVKRLGKQAQTRWQFR